MQNAKRKTVMCVALAAMFLPGTAGGDGGWWKRDWSYRRVLHVQPKADRFQEMGVYPVGRQAASVAVVTFGGAKPDASDVRVVGPDGKVRPMMVFSVGPGDLVRVGFAVSGRRKQRYYVYYGNPKAAKPDATWRPKTGLLLETFAYAGGPIGSVDAIVRTVQRARDKPIGRTFVGTIFTPGNVFGGQRRTCNLYTGYLVCRTAGTYDLALSSYDASALFVNDEMVVAWPGRHRWAGRARHQGKVTLKPGVHELKLYHVNLSGRGGVVVAYKQADRRRYEVISPDEFLPTADVTVGRLETRRKGSLPEFGYRQTSFSLVHGRGIFLYAFQGAWSGSGKVGEFAWDFGDGGQAKGRQVEHLFLKEGLHDVRLRLRVGQRRHEVTARVYVGPNRSDWRAQPMPLKEYVPILSTYDFATLDLASRLTLMELYLIVNRADLAIRVGGGGLPESADANAVADWAGSVAKLLVDYQGDYTRAAEVYREALTKVTSGDVRYGLVGDLVDVLVNHLGEDPEAVRLLQGPGMPATRPADDLPRAVAIGWGDVFRFRGQYALAERFYGLAKGKGESVDRITRRGGYAVAVEDYLRRKEFTAAAELIERWQWEDPAERLGGYSCYLRYRLELGRDRFEQAQRLARIINRVDPMGFYAQKMKPAVGR